MLRKFKLFLLNLLDIRKIAAIIPAGDIFNFYYTFYPVNPGKLTAIRIRGMDNKKVWVRRGSIIDRDVIKYVFGRQYHLPVRDLFGKRALILDLGSNIGLTLVHYHHLYPYARLAGYEMDASNYAISLRNTEGIDHCITRNQAVWTATGNISYSANAEDACAIVEKDNAQGYPKLKTAASITLADIFEDHAIDHVDYLKMDIEGAEKAIFDDPDLGWLSKVSELNIEIHQEAWVQRISDILTAKGFTCTRDSHHPALVHALRNSG